MAAVSAVVAGAGFFGVFFNKFERDAESYIVARPYLAEWDKTQSKKNDLVYSLRNTPVTMYDLAWQDIASIQDVADKSREELNGYESRLAEIKSEHPDLASELETRDSNFAWGGWTGLASTVVFSGGLVVFMANGLVAINYIDQRRKERRRDENDPCFTSCNL
jgi:hypothetical protein